MVLLFAKLATLWQASMERDKVGKDGSKQENKLI